MTVFGPEQALQLTGRGAPIIAGDPGGFNAALAYIATAGVTMSATVAAGANITAGTVADTDISNTVSFNATLNASTFASMSIGATATAEGVLLVYSDVSAEYLTINLVDVDLSFTTVATDTAAATAIALAAVNYTTAAGVPYLAGQANAEGQLSISAEAAVSVVGQAATQAGLLVQGIANVTYSGTSISGDIVTPDGRLFSVQIQTRCFDMLTDNRTFIVQLQNRSHDAEN